MKGRYARSSSLAKAMHEKFVQPDDFALEWARLAAGIERVVGVAGLFARAA
jgi:hypothetical protein